MGGERKAKEVDERQKSVTGDRETDGEQRRIKEINVV